MAKKPKELPRWVSLTEALAKFAQAGPKTESGGHIKLLHWYVACRLVIEGGFHPETIRPRPPFEVEKSGNELLLVHKAEAGIGSERTVFGGLKTKKIDVVVAHEGIGPVIAVSMKGTNNAFRNLTNRMEEAGGDCTNIHLAYPGMVYAFWHVFRANREGIAPPGTPSALELSDGRYKPQDVSIRADGTPSSQITRYYLAMERLSGRKDMRDEPSKYEAVGFTMVGTEENAVGQVDPSFPPPGSSLLAIRMFEKIYRLYDLRFVYQAPDLGRTTRRKIWSERSPALANPSLLDYLPRIGEAEDEAATMEAESAE
jgi:hypothetical protein